MALDQVAEVPTEALRYLNRLSDAFFVWSRCGRDLFLRVRSCVRARLVVTGRQGQAGVCVCVCVVDQVADVPTEALRYLNRLSDAFFVWSRCV